jgi:hypothetical protein
MLFDSVKYVIWLGAQLIAAVQLLSSQQWQIVFLIEVFVL